MEKTINKQTDSTKEVSIVIPVYNEENSINELYSRIKKTLINTDFEVIFVDDGSTDNTLNVLRELNKNNKNVKVVSFFKNLGKSSAYSVGFEKASGRIIITMDGDLQDLPEEIPKLINKINQGYHLVNGWKVHKYKNKPIKTINSKIYNFLTRILTGIKLKDFNSPFKAYRSYVAKDLNLYGGLYRYIPVLARWNGYNKITEIPVSTAIRKHGRSKFKVRKIHSGFFDLLTAKFLETYTKSPLHFFGTIGLIFSALGFLIGIDLLYIWLQGAPIGNRPLLILAVLLLVLGIQFVSLGLLGEMITNLVQKDNKNIKLKEYLS